MSSQSSSIFHTIIHMLDACIIVSSSLYHTCVISALTKGTCSDDKLKLSWSNDSSGRQKWSRAAIEDLVSDTSLHQGKPELSLNCTRPKDTTSCIQNNACQLQTYGLEVFPCNYATILDPNQLLLNKHPYFLPSPIITVDTQFMYLIVTLHFLPPPFCSPVGHSSRAS